MVCDENLWETKDILDDVKQAWIREMSCQCKDIVHLKRNTQKRELDHTIRVVNDRNRV